MNTRFKVAFLLLAAVAVTAFAGVKAPFYQYDDSAFYEEQRPEQPWLGAQMISMKVAAGTTVWLSNYVQSWYAAIPDLHGNVFNMSEAKYGYIRKDDLNASYVNHSDYADKVIWSSGETTQITYTNDSGPQTQTTTGYLLDTFNADDEIFFVMTTIPSDGGETVDSFQYVRDLYGQDTPIETTLVSRVDGTHDLANNIRINFGINEIGREFVAVFDKPDFHGVSGQPLPGLLVAGVLAMGTVLAGKRLKKRC